MRFFTGQINRAFTVESWSAPWFFMASLVLAWSWFNPYVYLPWTDFAKDSHTAFCFALVGVFWYWRFRKQSFNIPALAHACSLVVSVVILQYFFGSYAYKEHAMWAIAALAACGLVCILAARLTSTPAGYGLTTVLCMAIVFAALLHLGVGIAQKFGLMPYDDINLPGLLMASTRDPMRPGGNFGQPNIFATFMIWALLASGWLFSRHHIGRLTCLVLSWLFCFGMALTQSRMIAVSLIVVLLLSWLGTRTIASRKELRHWILSSVLIYAMCTAALIAQAQWMGDTGLRSAVFNDSVRKIIYSSYFEASLLKPWLGWGMTHLAEVQWTVWPSGEGSGILYLHAHNIVLDFALWVGWPLTLLLAVWLGWRALVRLNAINDMASWCAFASVAALFTHASFELPHTMAFFFLPAAWWIGILSNRADRTNPVQHKGVLSPSFKMPGVVGFAASAFLCVYLVVLVWEYHRIEPEFWRIRFENAKIGPPQPSNLPSTWILTPLADRITLQETKCSPRVNDVQIAQLERSTRGFPSLPSIYLTACTLGLTGKSEQAMLWMHRLNRIASPEQVAHYAQLWDKQREATPHIVTRPWPVAVLLPKDFK
jgi:Protein glycosylation ligase